MRRSSSCLACSPGGDRDGAIHGAEALRSRPTIRGRGEQLADCVDAGDADRLQPPANACARFPIAPSRAYHVAAALFPGTNQDALTST